MCHKRCEKCRRGEEVRKHGYCLGGSVLGSEPISRGLKQCLLVFVLSIFNDFSLFSCSLSTSSSSSLPFSPSSSSFSSAVCSPLSAPESLINPWMKLVKINSYSVLYCVSGLCREVYCIIKVQKVRDIFVGIRPRILFSGRKLIHGYYKANELSARILEGGFVKWKQRSAKRNREELR